MTNGNEDDVATAVPRRSIATKKPAGGVRKASAAPGPAPAQPLPDAEATSDVPSPVQAKKAAAPKKTAAAATKKKAAPQQADEEDNAVADQEQAAQAPPPKATTKATKGTAKKGTTAAPPAPSPTATNGNDEAGDNADGGGSSSDAPPTPTPAATSAAAPVAAAGADKKKRARATTTTAAPRKARTIRTFTQPYGDLTLTSQQRDYSNDAYKEFKAVLEENGNMTFTEWKQHKKDFFKQLDAVVKKPVAKKKTKSVDSFQTAENHLQRLRAMPSQTFAVLDGKWLSGYGFDGSFASAALTASGLPEQAAFSVFTVWEAAVHHGFMPKGIVSEKSTKNKTTDTMDYNTEVDGERVYVGAALKFHKKEKSIFALDNKDIVKIDVIAASDGTGAAAGTVGTATKRAPKKKAVATAATPTPSASDAPAEAEDDGAMEDGEVADE